MKSLYETNKSPESFRRVPVAWGGEEIRSVRVSSAKDITLIGLEFHPVLAVKPKVGYPGARECQ